MFWAKGKAPATECAEILVSLQLSVWAPTVVCVGSGKLYKEDLKQ